MSTSKPLAPPHSHIKVNQQSRNREAISLEYAGETTDIHTVGSNGGTSGTRPKHIPALNTLYYCTKVTMLLVCVLYFPVEQENLHALGSVDILLARPTDMLTLPD